MLDEGKKARREGRKKHHRDRNVCIFFFFFFFSLFSDHIEENGQSSNENPPSQPMDTIYVKEVRPDSPAYKSGLRPGDRILSVNDQSIQGKSYSQVIAIIQNTFVSKNKTNGGKRLTFLLLFFVLLLVLLISYLMLSQTKMILLL